MPLESAFSMGIFKQGAEFCVGILLFTHCLEKGVNPISPHRSQGRASGQANNFTILDKFLVLAWFVTPALMFSHQSSSLSSFIIGALGKFSFQIPVVCLLPFSFKFFKFSSPPAFSLYHPAF